MARSTSRLLRLLAVFLAFALFAAACGDDDDTEPVASTDSGTTDSGSDDSSADGEDEMAEDSMAEDGSDEMAEDSMAEDDGNMADDSMSPVKIGLIAQDQELFSFPEVEAAMAAYVGYMNAEEGGIDGHPIELDVCGAGDAPESHVACAQQFANADDVHLVVNGAFGTNGGASNPILAEAGKATITLGNDFADYLTPGVFTFDPGLLGLAQVFFVFASQNRGITNMTLLIADDPSLSVFIPVLQAIAGANGIEMEEVIPLGFEPDLTGPVSAADTSKEGWLFVLGDPAQCTAAASAVATVGYEGELFANDLCLGQDVVESGAVDGWAGPIVSTAPTVDGGAEVDEINRIFATYGNSDSLTTFGLGGWAIGNAVIARDILAAAGGADATDASALEALSTYSSSDVPGFPAVACPGAGAFAGGCNQAPLMVTIVDGQMTGPDGFVELDFTELEFLLEG